MELVFISGWATTASVWNSVELCGYPAHFLKWNNVLRDEYELPEESVLIGWSLGGQLAMELASSRKVKGLILVSSMSCIASSENRPGVDPSLHREIVSMLKRSRDAYIQSFFAECGAGSGELSALIEQSHTFSDDELFTGLNTMFNTVVTGVPDVPAILIHGTDDRIIPFPSAHYLKENVLTGNSSIIPVPGAGHLIPLHYPGIVAEAVNEIAEHTGS